MFIMSNIGGYYGKYNTYKQEEIQLMNTVK